ncbi:hypothetical protein [Rhodococcus opacus]|uniref:hypothetical protein n=1 Tax=Rhodococcus opacus TaxID=37919 RepID=UPI00211DDC7D|nr:hypothetical protein [Rhodococcus opacus]
MDAEANGGVDALRRNRLADWVAGARAVHRCGWTAAEPWPSGEGEAAGYDIQARSRAEAERYLGLAKATFAAEQDPTTGPAEV